MINILFEDNHIIVAEKPYGMLSQADITGDPDILTELKKIL
ncbi:RNA pseudouridine synthase, partial [Candidatus Dojkabacteria bacterium]|nr:RNA pseudouridine synthase [Candidatus Dojkabacteria bacterium]